MALKIEGELTEVAIKNSRWWTRLMNRYEVSQKNEKLSLRRRPETGIWVVERIIQDNILYYPDFLGVCPLIAENSIKILTTKGRINITDMGELVQTNQYGLITHTSLRTVLKFDKVQIRRID